MYVKSNTGVAQEIGIHREGSSLLSVIVPNEWTRITLSDNFTGSNFAGLELRGTLGTGALTSDILVWGAQLEELPFASSYIKTTTTAVTRGADNLSIAAAGNAAPYESEWALSMEHDVLGLNGTNQFMFDFGITAGVARQSRISATGTTVGADGPSSLTVITDVIQPNTPRKVVITREAGNTLTRWFLNGDARGVDVVEADTGSFATINIGNNGAGTAPIFGHFKSFRIYDVSLTPAQGASL
jgi:hypothetical protein